MKLAAGIILVAAAAATPDTRYFAYQRPVSPPPDDAGQTCLTLDPAVFVNASPSLSDLRLYHERVETPFVIRVASPILPSAQSIPLLNLGRKEKNTVFEAVMPDESYSDIELDITGEDFLATVTVSGSNSKTAASETKLGSYTIFDLKRQKLGRSNVLHLPDSNFRYLHFQIAGPVEPGNITGMTAVRAPASPPRYVTVATSSVVTGKDHFSVIDFMVPAHVPVDRIVFAPAAAPANFSRDVVITAAPMQEKPATDVSIPSEPVSSSGNLLRIHQLEEGHRIDEESLTVSPPASTFDVPSTWKILIDNGDDAPLIPQMVQLQMLQRDLCFQASANTRYTLYYGDGALQSPHYDYGSLFRPQAHAAEAKLGPEQRNPAFQARPDDRAFTEKHPALLWIALIAVIALLGGITLRSAGKAPQTPDDRSR